MAQVEFARDIATALKIEIQSSVLSNRSDCMKFISENLDNYFAISEKNGSPITVSYTHLDVYKRQDASGF